jgi:hypothetical protein
MPGQCLAVGFQRRMDFLFSRYREPELRSGTVFIELSTQNFKVIT